MIFFVSCNSNILLTDGEGYRVYYHRARDGACRNHQLSAAKLEAKIWTEVVAAINDPDQTRQGYAEAKAKHYARTRRQRARLANLQANLVKPNCSSMGGMNELKMGHTMLMPKNSKPRMNVLLQGKDRYAIFTPVEMIALAPLRVVNCGAGYVTQRPARHSEWLHSTLPCVK